MDDKVSSEHSGRWIKFLRYLGKLVIYILIGSFTGLITGLVIYMLTIGSLGSSLDLIFIQFIAIIVTIIIGAITGAFGGLISGLLIKKKWGAMIGGIIMAAICSLIMVWLLGYNFF